MTRRSLWLAVGLAASAAATVLLWVVGVPGLFLFLFLPFLWPLARPATPARRCPRCGRPAAGREERFCPLDGEPLANA